MTNKFKYLFKYYPNNEYSFNNLKDFSFYLNNPHKFNDPYDCKVFIDGKATMTEIKTTLKKMFKKDSSLLNQINIIKDNEVKEYWDSQCKNINLLELYKMLLITCFSEINDDIRMWSNYSNNHEGFCIAYRAIEIDDNDIIMLLNPDCFTKKYVDQFGLDGWYPIKKVNYVDNNPSSIVLKNFDNLKLEDIDDIVLKKYITWCYEKEYRLVLSTDVTRNNLIQYHPRCISHVIFGAKMKQEEKKRLVKIIYNLSENGNWIKFHQAELDNSTYKIIIKEIKM